MLLSIENSMFTLKKPALILLDLFQIYCDFWYHKNSYIFLIIILKFHALIPCCSEENIKNLPNLLIMEVTTIYDYNCPLFEFQRQFIFLFFWWLSLSSRLIDSKVKLQ